MELAANSVAAVLLDHGVAVLAAQLVHRRTHVAQVPPGAHGRKARLDGLFACLDQAPALVRDLANAVHAAGVREVPALDGGHVNVDDVAILKDVLLVGEAVADDVVDRGAHAVGIALEVEVGRYGVVRREVLLDPAVDVHGRDTCGDVLANVVEYAHVDGGRGLDALDVRGGLEERAGQNLLAVEVQALHALVRRTVALLVLAATPAPAGVVAPGNGQLVKHGVSHRVELAQHCNDTLGERLLAPGFQVSRI